MARAAVVNLFEPARTAYDWNFRLGDVPVRVNPWFWLTAIVLGLRNDQTGLDFFTYLLAWVGVLLVSILVHEMGHVLMGRYYGADGHIVLTGFVGLAIGSSNLPERRQRIAVSLAGPGAGFLLACVLLLVLLVVNPELPMYYLAGLVGVWRPIESPPHHLVDFAIRQLIWVNMLWGLVNLLPVWPLDGGKISREICQHYRNREGIRLSLQISLVVSAGIAVVALISVLAKRSLIPFLQLDQSLFPALFFGIFAYGSYQLLQVVSYLGPRGEEFEEDDQPRLPWEQDADWWKSGKSPWRE